MIMSNQQRIHGQATPRAGQMTQHQEKFLYTGSPADEWPSQALQLDPQVHDGLLRQHKTGQLGCLRAATAVVYRTSPQKSMGLSLYQVLFGQLMPLLEGSCGLLDNAKPSNEWIAKLQEAQQIIHNQVTSVQDQSKDEMVQHHRERKGGSYAPGDRVLV